MPHCMTLSIYELRLNAMNLITFKQSSRCLEFYVSQWQICSLIRYGLDCLRIHYPFVSILVKNTCLFSFWLLLKSTGKDVFFLNQHNFSHSTFK